MTAEVAVASTPDEFWAWCNDAPPGAICEYHRGITVCAETGRRTKSGDRLYAKVPVAHEAWKAFEFGAVTLVQRRGPVADEYRYLAIRSGARRAA